MKKRTALLFLLSFATAPLRAEPAPTPSPTLTPTAAITSIPFGRYGDVTITQPAKAPQHAVILISGRDGWNPTMDHIAAELSAQGALVMGVDGARMLNVIRIRQEKCAYPATDFETMSQTFQKQLGVAAYLPPVLIGMGAGGTLAYAALAQAPPTTFAGAISLGFCPVLPVSKPFCKGNGLDQEAVTGMPGFRFLPAKTLEAPWVVLEGKADEVCDEKLVEAFSKQVLHGDIVLLPNVDHKFSDEKLWMTQLRDVFARVAAGEDPTPDSEDASTKGLPLIEIPAKGTAKDVYAILISGDGGWAGIDRSLGKSLSEQGVSVVGLNSLKYFWKKRNPDEAGNDLERIMRHYFAQWKKKSVILVGYSRGADVLPFMANRLPADMRARTSLVVLLGLEKSIEFEIHAGAIFNMKGKNELPIRPELDKLKGQKVACFYGSDESDSLCRELPPDLAEVIVMKGGHHFDGDYKGIAQQILSRAK